MNPVDLPKDIFRSTAGYYVRYRARYPQAFIDDVAARFGLGPASRVLDLGCGPATLTLPLAAKAGVVIGLDPEPEMLTVARQEADAAAVDNVSFVDGGSSELTSLQAQLGRFDLVTMAESFHWMDQRPTLATLYEMIKPGGGIMISWIHRSTSPVNTWIATTTDAIIAWLGSTRRAGSGFYEHPQPLEDKLLLEAGFDRVLILPAEGSPYAYTHEIDIDDILGWLYSTSYASPYVLGEARAGFEADLRQRLLRGSPSGRFQEEWTVGAYLGWKP